MSRVPARFAGPAQTAARLVGAAIAGFQAIPSSAVALLARLSIANIFWLSGRTKVEPGTLFTLADGALQLFKEEYRIPLFAPGIAAYAATASEHLFPVLLVLGLASRFAACALLIMTLVIQIFVYPEAYNVHGPWAVCLLFIMIQGPGPISLDHLIAKRWHNETRREMEPAG